MNGADVTSGQTEVLVERLFAAAIDTLEIASVHLGVRLGLYGALANGGDATPAELAARTGTVERYVREWLEQQAVAGFLSVNDPDAEADERRYGLPLAHRSVFVDEQDLNHLAPLATLAISVLRPMDALLAAYRGGGGVPYEAYGADTRDGIGALNRPMFVNQLADWLASIPEVDGRLRAQPPARVGDLACGTAWSSIAIARAYPEVRVDAIDIDPASIETARANVAGSGLSDRVRPILKDASDPELGDRYDLVTIFEALHDMNHPVQALRAARNMLAEAGSIVVADERVAERFTAPGDELERFNYGWSVLHCLAVGMLDEDSAGTGTMIRAETVRAYATEAGFGRVDVLPIEHDFWRFYRLVP
ncbi:MAG: methyltransferase domain-containing protein [Candidatus Dormibacteraeota bacterium]|nr:methyltransferase domain-containing protein [Candidatus Dormibacteraeota bacterium]